MMLLLCLRRPFVILALGGFLLLAGCQRSPTAPPVALRVVVDHEGVYRVAAADLRAQGWADPAGVSWRLTRMGVPQSVWRTGTGNNWALHFYGRTDEDAYSQEQVYWLMPDATPSPEMQAAAGSNEAAAYDVYTATTRLETQRTYQPQATQPDHWFGQTLAAPATASFTITLDQLVPGAAQLRVALWATTEDAAQPDNHIQLAVNGVGVGDRRWDGRGTHLITTTVPLDTLHAGANTITLTAPGDTGVVADVVLVDWIELQYGRSLVAQNGQLAWTSAGGLHQLQGWNAPPLVFDITDADAPQRMPLGNTVAATAHRRYLAVATAAAPTRLEAVAAAPDLRTKQAAYLAIGPPALLAPLAPLLAWRESQGLTTLAVPLATVYDQWNHGQPDPVAIQRFVGHALTDWASPPRFLLLVGDASYDPHGYVAPPEANQTPTLMLQTVWGGETASDTAFAQTASASWAALAIGRLPARTAAEVTIAVNKTVQYEQAAPPGAWRGRSVAVADPSEPDFAVAAQRWGERVAAPYQFALVTPAAPQTDVSAELQASALITYFGHGSLEQWGRDRLLHASDSANLGGNGQLPVVINMTCLTGLFTHPTKNSLAEALLWQRNSGAVAVLAATSLTLPTDQQPLSDALVAGLMQRPTATLGEVLVAAHAQLDASNPGSRDVRQTFLLFGDPALRLVRP